MDPATYKHLREQFVSDLPGTTMLEIAALSAIFPAFLLLRKWSFILSRNVIGLGCSSKTWINCLQDLSLDFIFVIIPTLTAVTILSDRVYLIAGSVFCTASVVFWILRKRSPASNIPDDEKKGFKESRLQFVSSYRFAVMLFTCISILAVDFNIFPRRYAKAETYGNGLMDIGVGSFVFANALVSRQARSISNGKEHVHIFRSIGPLLFMGFARLYLTRGVDYQLHVGEYGVHWNFFFTLSAVALLTHLVQIPPYLCGIFGVAIIFGYWGLYLVGVHLGYFIFRPEKGFLKEKSRFSLRYASKIWLLTALFWLLALLFDSFVEQVSRRMCNLAYVMLTLAVNLLGLGVLVISELISGGRFQQLILEEIFTSNMLATFLFANVLTGLVNLSVDTLFASTSVAYGILVTYLLVLIIGMGLLRIMRIKIRF